MRIFYKPIDAGEEQWRSEECGVLKSDEHLPSLAVRYRNIGICSLASLFIITVILLVVFNRSLFHNTATAKVTTRLSELISDRSNNKSRPFTPFHSVKSFFTQEGTTNQICQTELEEFKHALNVQRRGLPRLSNRLMATIDNNATWRNIFTHYNVNLPALPPSVYKFMLF